MAGTKLLILGGTRFLGRHLVDAALARRCKITLFNRGQSNPDLFPNVETVIGDRDGNLEPLAGRKWDAVIDTCGYVPRLLKDSVKFLADAVEHYTFISTVSVYADPGKPGLTEEAPLAELAEETEEVTEETYGALKALCEKEVLEVFGAHDNALIVRPGLIVGPWDPSDRFTYWVDRVERGGEVLAPGPPDRPVQFIDARDLARWIIWMIRKGRPGIYNAAGPYEGMTIGEFLETCNEVTAGDAQFIWVSEEFLEKEDVMLPVWVPTSYLGFSTVRNEKITAAGIDLRSVEETIAGTLFWLKRERDEEPLRTGITSEKEKELLAKWHKMEG